MNVVGIVAGAGVLMAFTWLLLWWAGRRDFLFFGNAADRPSSAMGSIVGELTELFQPGRRIEQEERQRAKEAKQEDESGAPPMTVDLTAGTAVFRRGRPRS